MSKVKLRGAEGNHQKEVFESQFSISRGIFSLVKSRYKPDSMLKYADYNSSYPNTKPENEMLCWNDVSRQMYVTNNFIVRSCGNPTAHGLEKLHGFAMKIVKKHWQAGTPHLTRSEQVAH